MLKYIGLRIKVWGTTRSGITSTFAGTLDYACTTHIILDRMPIYNVTKWELSPSQFQRKWKTAF